MSNERIVVCMKWGKLYTHDYVNVLFHAVSKNVTGKFRFVCLTDNAEGIDPKVECIPIPDIGLHNEHFYHGAWPKISILKDDLFSSHSKVLFIDLDMVICGNLDQMFTYSDKFVAINEGVWNATPPSLMSSIFCFETGKYQYIVDALSSNVEEVTHKYDIEQNYLHNALKEKEYWPSEWIVSFKRHLRKPLIVDMFVQPAEPSPGTKIIAFHGKPRPIDLVNSYFGNRDVFPHLILRKVNWLERYWIDNGGTLN